MANVMEILGRIKTAIYGRDVRQSIYDAILQCYNDATGNPESIAAHTGDTNNPHNVTAEQVGLANAEEDISQAQKDISGLKNPEFEDFTSDGSTPPDARTAIAAITSKMSFFTYLSKVKAALMGLVTLGEMRSLLINNGLTTEAGKYFLDAAYGKTLLDKITQLNSDFIIPESNDYASIDKYGHVDLSIVTTADYTGELKTIFTIDAKYRPTKEKMTVGKANMGEKYITCTFYIRVNGNVDAFAGFETNKSVSFVCCCGYSVK